MENTSGKVDFVNLRHIYAPLDISKKGHVCMPTAMLTAWARMEMAGVGVGNFFDENLREYQGNSLIVAAGLVGAIAIPGALELSDRLPDRELILGGQILKTLTAQEKHQLFCKHSRTIVDGNNDATLGDIIGFDHTRMPAPEKTSLIPAYEKIPQDLLIQYLNHEIPLYVSQGCKYGCSFCAAEKKQGEVYRDPNIVERDLDWLVTRAEQFFAQGSLPRRQLSFYLSHLDTFQNPKELGRFADAVKKVRQNHTQHGKEFEIPMRGLSTVREFLNIAEHYPDVIKNLIEAGFHTVGLGIDGMTAAVWQMTKKTHNYKSNKSGRNLTGDSIANAELCTAAIRRAKEFGMKVELLMVFGHIDPLSLDPIDTEESMRLAYEFLHEMQEEQGAIPRPQVVKPYPGNEAWAAPVFQPVAESIIRHPGAFQLLDFVGQPNAVSHQDPYFRERITFWLEKMCALGANRSETIVSVDAAMGERTVSLPTKKRGIIRGTRSKVIQIVDSIPDGALERMQKANEGKYDR